MWSFLPMFTAFINELRFYFSSKFLKVSDVTECLEEWKMLRGIGQLLVKKM